MSERSAWRVLRRSVFIGYGLALFVATHWPALTIPGEGRKDLIIHVGAFAVWASALIACGFFGLPFSRRNILVCGVVAVAYAAIDEGSQAIPWVRRTAAWDDYAADVSGIALAVGVALIVAAARRAACTPISSEPE